MIVVPLSSALASTLSPKSREAITLRAFPVNPLRLTYARPSSIFRIVATPLNRTNNKSLAVESNHWQTILGRSIDFVGAVYLSRLYVTTAESRKITSNNSGNNATTGLAQFCFYVNFVIVGGIVNQFTAPKQA